MTLSDENVSRNRPLPRGLVVAIVLTGLMFYRAPPAPFVWGRLGEDIPQVWQIPFSGDVFIGLTAWVVAYLLWKRGGPVVWMLGIVFHAVGIQDFLVAAQMMFLAPNPMIPDPYNGLMFMNTLISVHLLCIALLMRNRDHYLKT